MIKGVVLGFVAVAAVAAGFFWLRSGATQTAAAGATDAGVDAPEVTVIISVAHRFYFGDQDALDRCVEGALGNLDRNVMAQLGDGARPGQCPVVRPSLAVCTQPPGRLATDLELISTGRTIYYSYQEVFESQSAFRHCIEAGHEWVSVDRGSVEALRAQSDEIARSFR
jgi:hypothetical protein